MMTELHRARENTSQMGQILSLLRLPINRSGATFSPIVTVYADMLDPLGTSERRHAARLIVLEPVRKHAIV